MKRENVKQIQIHSLLLRLIIGIFTICMMLFMTFPEALADEAGIVTQDKNSLTPYSDVITEDADTQPGVFIVHRIIEGLFFEIPQDILTRLGYPTVNEKVTNLQKDILDMLFNANRIQRLIILEDVQSDAMTVAELVQSLADEKTAYDLRAAAENTMILLMKHATQAAESASDRQTSIHFKNISNRIKRKLND